jgi:hypothetical protein
VANLVELSKVTKELTDVVIIVFNGGRMMFYALEMLDISMATKMGLVLSIVEELADTKLWEEHGSFDYPINN